MRCLLLCLLAATVLPGRALADGDPAVPVVAVFEIEDRTKTLKKAARWQLTEYLATRMGEGGTYRVVPPADVRRRLVQQKGESYKRCYDERCQIELGRELAAAMTLSTKVLHIGKQCQLTFNIYDLAKAATHKSASVRAGCSEEQLMNALDRGLVALGALPQSAVTGPTATSPAATSPRKKSPRPGACPHGMVHRGTGCCWPGQDWGEGSGRCIGEPSACPPGTRKTTRDCRRLSPGERRTACRKTALDPCIQQCEKDHPEDAFIRQCYLERNRGCRAKGKQAYMCGGDEKECDRMCKDDSSPGTCSNICMQMAKNSLRKCHQAWDSYCPQLPACQQAMKTCLGG